MTIDVWSTPTSTSWTWHERTGTVPGRHAGARHGRHSGTRRRFDQTDLLLRSREVERAEVRPRRGRGAVEAGRRDPRLAAGRRDGHPDVLIGGLDPTGDPADLARQLDAADDGEALPRHPDHGRGEHAFPIPMLLQALQDGGLSSSSSWSTPASSPRRPPRSIGWEPPVAVEHTGWPRSNDPDEYALWKTGMAALAALGDNVTCKLSGLATPMQSMAAATFKPWVLHAIELFGTDRCMFASNFPVDGMHGSFDDLDSTYDELTADLDDATRDQLFAGNAERVYGR